MIPSEEYNRLEPDRKKYLTRAEEISKLTLPYILNEEGFSGNTSTRHEITQSFNGMLVNNLKAKMGLALLPPSTSSFRLTPDSLAMQELFGGNENAIAQLNQELSMATDMINREVEYQQIRSDLFDLITHLIVVGCAVVEKIKGKGVQIVPLNRFVAELDNKGNAHKIVIKETMKFLPEGITFSEEKEEYELYTMISYDNDSKRWVVTQDIDGEPVGEEKTYTDETLPFRYLGWTWNYGDSYHRAFAEDYIDDMKQVNILSKLNTQGAVVAGKINIFVDQRGNRTKKRDVALSENGAVLDGRADDVTAFQLNKNFDFQVTNERQAEIMKTLKQCFLDSGAVTRDAERVTAQEIRVMAQQLESSTLAGIYSRMSLQWSKWIIEQVMLELSIKFESFDVDVITGLDALGRSQEEQKMDAFIQRMAQLQMMDYVNVPELISRYASYAGINTVNLIKTPQQVQQERQAAQQQAMQQQMAMQGGETLAKEGVTQAIKGGNK